MFSTAAECTRLRFGKGLPSSLVLMLAVALSACSSGSGDSGSAASPPAQQPQATNHAPIISGTPSTTAPATVNYSFMPTTSDADGDSLAFQITNKPSWATFSTATGMLSGIPAATLAGTVYSGIVISVSDGTNSISMPAFSIQVLNPPNRPPVISGTPATSVLAGAAYQFQPTATDPEGKTVTFSIQNKPSWATFNATTGLLSGTPQLADVGLYSRIVVSASDGQMTAALPAFDISVTQIGSGSATLSWTAPTLNTDGSALTDLAGYRIYYGTSASQLNQTVDINTAGISSYVVGNLNSGNYYFAISARNAQGVESSRSNIASKLIP